MPAFSVIRATPESITEMPYSSDLVCWRGKNTGKSIARMQITVPSMVVAFTWFQKVTLILY